MKPVYVVGAGKLAQELLTGLPQHGLIEVRPWAQRAEGPAVVVHAGSGREGREVWDWCQETQSPLIELATGQEVLGTSPFPIVICPNVNLLMLRVMALVARSGNLFQTTKKTLVESHQATKTTEPGTAYHLADSLGIPRSEVVSHRDPSILPSLGIPEAHRDRHAFHRLVLEESGTQVILETRVWGEPAYAAGTARIVEAVKARTLEPRVYSVLEFVENGWI